MVPLESPGYVTQVTAALFEHRDFDFEESLARKRDINGEFAWERDLRSTKDKIGGDWHTGMLQNAAFAGVSAARRPRVQQICEAFFCMAARSKNLDVTNREHQREIAKDRVHIVHRQCFYSEAPYPSHSRHGIDTRDACMRSDCGEGIV